MTKETKMIRALQAEQVELTPYFDQVCPNKVHWKDPIHTTCLREDQEKVARAIGFFTATEAVFSEMCPPSIDRIQVQSIGYRAGPAGDH